MGVDRSRDICYPLHQNRISSQEEIEKDVRCIVSGNFLPRAIY